MILRDGLMPMTRRYVHLSVTREEAVKVGRRHSRNVVLLKVHAREAYESGAEFIREAGVFLTMRVPPEFIEVTDFKK